MATYFHGNTEIQGNSDGSQTMIFMNPVYDVGSQPPPNSVFLNPSSAANPPPSQIQHLAGIPIQTTTNIGAAKQGLSSQKPTVFGTGEDIGVSGASSLQSVVLSSRYLNATKELLDEVVNVGKQGKSSTQSDNGPGKKIGESSAAAGVGESNGGEGVAKREGELTTSEKLREIQMKKAKLVNMLDEVEQRYKQYKQDMQMVTCWFEQIAGIRSSKTYTALALETISKQFRNLKDEILCQIRVASKIQTSGSRLHIHQQRTLQQLGMIKHDVWRPQRGLPERSVSLLRAWLFQHFFHPYPEDSDKVMLAKQTGLTRSQVSNWFINARVRLWKPMVEEMYAEEMKGSKDGKTEQNDVVSTSKSLSQTSETMEQGSPKNPCNADASMNVNLEIEKQDRDGFTLTGAPTNFIEGFGSCPIMEFGAPYSGNGVSLTLGLPHSGPHQSFLPDYFTGMNTISSSTHSTSVYAKIDIQGPKRFGAHLLPDFLA